jgi:hypothetical protein
LIIKFKFKMEWPKWQQPDFEEFYNQSKILLSFNNLIMQKKC